MNKCLYHLFHPFLPLKLSIYLITVINIFTHPDSKLKAGATFPFICHVESLQSCLTLCNPMDCSSPSPSVPGILQARILEWAIISFSNVCEVASVMSDSVQPYGLQPPRLLCPWDSPGKNTRMGCRALLQGIFLTQGWNPRLLRLPALAIRFFTTSATWKTP